MIYTRNGDDGFTTLHGVRISKASLQCELLGSLDELNCLIGLCKIKAEQCSIMLPSHILLKDVFEEIQHVLFIMQALSAGYQKPIDGVVVNKLESYIGSIELSMQMPTNFVLAGGTETAAFFDYVRTIVRRVERLFVSFVEHQKESLPSVALVFLNRLSSFMYVCARFENFRQNHAEIGPCYSATKCPK